MKTLYRIGQIVPSSNTTMETEIPAMLTARQSIRAERFTFHSSRMRMKKVVKEELAAMDAESDRCAIELSDARVDVLGYACLVAIMAMGLGYHRQSEKRLTGRTIEEGTNIPVVTSAGGFILPNDHVDVIMTRRAQDFDNGPEQFITETILSNIRVLAIDQTIAEQNGVAVVVGRTATLELTPLQAEILTVAGQMSDRLTLSLRSLADADAPVAPDAVHLINGDTRTNGVTVIRNGVAVQVNPGL